VTEQASQWAAPHRAPGVPHTGRGWRAMGGRPLRRPFAAQREHS